MQLAYVSCDQSFPLGTCVPESHEKEVTCDKQDRQVRGGPGKKVSSEPSLHNKVGNQGFHSITHDLYYYVMPPALPNLITCFPEDIFLGLKKLPHL